jgi:hypothetical protein
VSGECKTPVFSTQFRFLLAKLQMEHILSPRSPKAQLEGFKTVPKGLYSAYNGVIERIESGRQGDADCAMRIFSWIYHARRILKMDELLEALVIAEYSQDIMSGEHLDEDLEAILDPATSWRLARALFYTTNQVARYDLATRR